jgi:hypothetical protein
MKKALQTIENYGLPSEIIQTILDNYKSEVLSGDFIMIRCVRVQRDAEMVLGAILDKYVASNYGALHPFIVLMSHAETKDGDKELLFIIMVRSDLKSPSRVLSDATLELVNQIKLLHPDIVLSARVLPLAGFLGNFGPIVIRK